MSIPAQKFPFLAPVGTELFRRVGVVFLRLEGVLEIMLAASDARRIAGMDILRESMFVCNKLWSYLMCLLICDFNNIWRYLNKETPFCPIFICLLWCVSLAFITFRIKCILPVHDRFVTRSTTPTIYLTVLPGFSILRWFSTIRFGWFVAFRRFLFHLNKCYGKTMHACCEILDRVGSHKWSEG